jgi:hypothetical protein
MAAGKRYNAQPHILLRGRQPNFAQLVTQRRQRLSWQKSDDILAATEEFEAEINGRQMKDTRPRHYVRPSQDSAREYSPISSLRPA